EEGVQAQQNPETFGNAWFVDNIIWAEDADDEILKLGEADLSNTAIINKEYRNLVPETISRDTSARIELVSHRPNELVYKSNSSKEGLAVFSEMYYPHGWKALIDGKEITHFPANYVLRAMPIPAGEHEITFKF